MKRHLSYLSRQQIAVRCVVKASFVVLCGILSLSCRESTVAPPVQTRSNVYFEIELVNFAWGYTYQGKEVGGDGNLYYYNPAKDTVAVLYHPDNLYTEQELQSKYQHGNAYLLPVMPDTLYWARNLANSVTWDHYSDTIGAGADMGSTTYSVYLYRPEQSRYLQVVLRQEGDWIFYNTSPQATQLAGWLKRLNQLSIR